MPRFYVDYQLVNNKEYLLPETVVRHINVLRLRLTSEIVLFNGDGNNYFAQITELGKREARARVGKIEPANNTSKVSITLAMSIIANDKFDMVLQKAVELGINKIIPVFSHNTQRIKLERLANRMEHWHKIIISASEQCGRADLAKLVEPIDLCHLLPVLTEEGKFILSPHHQGSSISNKSIQSAVIMVGPEGGFTNSEVEEACKFGFTPLLLGNRILRAETAALAGICHLHSIYGEFDTL